MGDARPRFDLFFSRLRIVAPEILHWTFCLYSMIEMIHLYGGSCVSGVRTVFIPSSLFMALHRMLVI